jgi:beta-lactam-binding protein with PASTA domain
MTRQSGFGRPGSQRALFPRSFYAVTAFLISWSCGLLSVAHLNAATIVSELGAAGPANFTVLSLGGNTGQINFTGSGTINGNAGMPNSGEYIASGSADLTGILYLGSQSSKKISGSAKIQGGTQQNTKSNSLLNSAVQAADAASSYFAGLPPTPVSITCTPKCTSLPFQTMGSGAKFTITGTKAVNVLDLKGINIPHGATVTFYSKVAGAEFVINNSGPFQIGSDVTITVAGTVSPYAVVLNHTGNEEAQISSGSILTGIILAPIAAIQIESATFTGEVIGGKNAAVQISGQTKLVQPSIAVPNVVGATQSAATTDIEAVGLILGTVTTASSPTVPSGDVISESPIAGKLVKPGSAVNLVVSSGPAEVAVPNVVGSTQAAATSAIKAAGLIVGTVTTAPSSTIPSGSVISENPTAGTMVNAGSAVNLVISSGPGQVAVPNVVGSTQAAATTTIQNAGLVVGTVTTQSSSTVPSGDVISETPTAGTMVNAGSAVNLVISSGPAQVAVPNVVGSTQAAATSAIKAAGLVVGTITTAPSNTVPSGSVISESPTAGTMVNVGSAVNLVVSSGPGQVSVPNVVGSTQAAATTAIQNAGLVVGTVTTHSSSTVPSGDVISETPSAGTMVNAGSAVNLVISSGPAQVAVPNVVGSTQAAATTAIQNAGLVVGTVTTASSSTVPSGDVISETPSAGTMVNAGSAVNLVISSGPAQVAVPNVVGSSQAAATTAIQSAGLVVRFWYSAARLPSLPFCSSSSQRCDYCRRSRLG